MANNDYITTDCKLTVSKNTAKLDEEIFLYKNDRNIKLLIEIVDNKYRYKPDDLSNLLVKYKASYAQVKWYKNAEVKKEFPIQATDDGKVVFVIEGELINEDTELGDYDLQLRLLNESQESIRSLPIIKGAVHILKPLFEEGDIATVNSAIADVSMLSLGGDAIDTYNSDGTYNQTNWGSGDIISSSKLNKLEKVAKDNVDKVNKMPAKSIVEGGKIYLAKEDGTKLDSGTELPAGGSTIEVVNNLESDSTTAALSAAQGKALNTQYKDIVNKIESGNIGTTSKAVEPQLMDMPRIYFSEGTLPTTKTATVMKFDYYSKTHEEHGYVDIKCQGNSSMEYNKKNFTIKLYKEQAKTNKLKIDFKGWGKQSKFVLKANWIDITHARNVVSARIWGDVIKTRSDYATAIPELLRTSPNQGAIDGFPVLVYSNGVYQGRYTLNIPKDKWMSNMDDALDTHCILCGENYQSGCFRALPQINGSDWTDELHDVVPATIKTSWTNAINFVMTSSDTEFKANLSNYFDVNSLIDYLLYGHAICHIDGFGKNQLFFTYDGVHWIASVYDLDSTFGLWWDGSKIISSNTIVSRAVEKEVQSELGNLLYIRLADNFISELKTRYAELRKEVLSASHIIQRFEEFIQICPKDIVQEDYASTTGGGSFTSIPSTSTNNIQQIRSFIVTRLTYVDNYINSLKQTIPCTNITLNSNTLSFTNTTPQTLTATLTPTNTSDVVTWSVNPTGICTVENGVVTPISNGDCVITATCGSHSATCNVTVSEITVIPVSNISLDKSNIAVAPTKIINLKELSDSNFSIPTWGTASTDYIVYLVNLNTTIDNFNISEIYTVTINDDCRPIQNKPLSTDVVDGYCKQTDYYAYQEWDNNTYLAIPFKKSIYGDTSSAIKQYISDNNIIVKINESYQIITATISPSNANNKNVVWSKNNDNVDIAPNGLTCKITGRTKGNSIVTCTAENSQVNSTCNITIDDSVASYAVTRNLSGATSTNTENIVTGSYLTTITPNINKGVIIQGKVEMGGENITSNVCTLEDNRMNVNIPQITGNITIKCWCGESEGTTVEFSNGQSINLTNYYAYDTFVNITDKQTNAISLINKDGSNKYGSVAYKITNMTPNTIYTVSVVSTTNMNWLEARATELQSLSEGANSLTINTGNNTTIYVLLYCNNNQGTYSDLKITQQ